MEAAGTSVEAEERGFVQTGLADTSLADTSLADTSLPDTSLAHTSLATTVTSLVFLDASNIRSTIGTSSSAFNAAVLRWSHTHPSPGRIIVIARDHGGPATQVLTRPVCFPHLSHTPPQRFTTILLPLDPFSPYATLPFFLYKSPRQIVPIDPHVFVSQSGPRWKADDTIVRDAGWWLENSTAHMLVVTTDKHLRKRCRERTRTGECNTNKS